jgi:hypothetical protein
LGADPLHEAVTRLCEMQVPLRTTPYWSRSRIKGKCMGIAAKLVTEEAEELLRAPRMPSQAGGTIRGVEPHTYDIVVKDLSLTGCFVETRALLSIGSVVQLRIAGVPQTGARIVRRDRDGYGCEFLVELSAEDLSASRDGETAGPPLRGRSQLPAVIVVLAAAMAVVAAGPWSTIDRALMWVEQLRG